MISMALLGACDDGADDPPASEVGQAGALTALVEWQADEQEPVLDDAGEERLPVIYIAAAQGGTIDVGVQADVAAATVDVATVRFADEATEAFNDDLEGRPVIDDGSMLLVGALPDPAPVVLVDLVRYTAAEDSEALLVEITANGGSAIGPATVTSVTQP
jgi:hypothetical protein